MGAMFREVCYGDAATAAAAQCASAYPALRVEAGQHISEACAVADSGASLSIVSTIAETASTATVLVPVSYGVCDPMEHYDSLTALWLAGLIGIIAIALVRMAYYPFTQNQ